ncbi:SpaH/EbpB family LPXTG-anchored major pilin [Agrococcus carbonis]|uniref:LPXTG-motif cell wall anchor domain-containing protein/fimbrial isopeptide formation D2 domain-containing protein n=1 Tax=Agrococcus carbonis TaxID=684552 RepID=A0A1H1N7U5_9MICO|nr:SpaH/EbpB family LPXTG-anchored major pilin [Agrococcus carbonis]SDR95093.1 LPXTG-motif cell wall anchor domain-containing protein/fimbrial isopeptide formation D2 domain-containing protein [Agrococcus carbonis]
MATTTKSLSARIVAGFGAVALATLAAFGAVLPASAAANIDPAAPAAITIHKHEQTGAAGAPGTGASTDPVAGDPISGVDYSIRRVTSLDVAQNSTWTTLRTLKAPAVIAAPATYPLGATAGVNAWTVTTGADGSVRQVVPQGVYLVEELDAPAAAGIVIKSQPFLVVVPQPVEATGAWNYDVHVFPKSTVSDVTNRAEAFEQEGLGSNVTWTLDIGVPVATAGTTVDSFVITETLDDRLAHTIGDTGAVRITVGSTTLVRGTDFSVTLTGQALRIEFTAAGRAVLAANPDQRVAVAIDTTVQSFGAGTIGNSATITINGASITSNTASVYFGGIELQKNDDNGAPLQGAIFEVVDASGEVVAIGGRTEFTSDVNGVVAIAGLRTDANGAQTYLIREKSAPAGYVLGATTEWTLAIPVGVNAAVEAVVVNDQVPAYALPITGGAGQAAFMIGGAGLLLGALGFMLVRRRKAAEQG